MREGFAVHREWNSEILIVGASFGGVSAALAAARAGRRVVLTEETGWIGGQATAQGVPLDEHPWIERYGSSESYRQFRRSVREYYRRNYPLTEQSRADRAFNPGAGWVSALCFEPKVGRAVLEEMLAPYLSAGRILLVLHHRPVAVQADGDLIRAVTLACTRGGDLLTVAADYVLDATDLGELLELGKIEHVIGAEAHDETAEPTALEQADPLRQQGFTHLVAVDYRPGEDHTIERPPDYDRFRDGFASLVGMSDDSALKQRRLFVAGMADPTRSAGSLGTAEDRETRAGGLGRRAAEPSHPLPVLHLELPARAVRGQLPARHGRLGCDDADERQRVSRRRAVRGSGGGGGCQPGGGAPHEPRAGAFPADRDRARLRRRARIPRYQAAAGRVRHDRRSRGSALYS